MPGVGRWSSRALGSVVLATLVPSLLGASRAHGHITDETKPPLARVLAPEVNPPASDAAAPAPSDGVPPPPAPPSPPAASLPPPSPPASLFLPPLLPPPSAFAQISVGRRTQRAWYDNAFWGGPPAGTARYRSTMAELGLTTNFAAVGEARGAVGLHYTQRGYLTKVGSGFALTVDGYARVLGGNAQGYAARLVWSFFLGRALSELPIILDVGVSSALIGYKHEVSKGAPLGLTVGLMVPLGRWAQLDAKANIYLGGDRQAEVSLVGNLTNRFYAGAGATTWFGSVGGQFFGGVRL